jgi:prepilin-type processing-associated H-X9-DG protein
LPHRHSGRDAHLLHELRDERLFRRRRHVQRHPGRARGQVKKLSEISVPVPAFRLAFLDEGRVTPDAYAIHYLRASWWDPPFVRHADGTNVSFADGHSDYWKYTAKETIEVGKMANPTHNYSPTTPEGIDDVQRMQIATWGRLGY